VTLAADPPTPGYYCLAGVTLTASNEVDATIDNVDNADIHYGFATIEVDTSPNATVCPAGDILVVTYFPTFGETDTQASFGITVN
jgi:hypothetical protein